MSRKSRHEFSRFDIADYIKDEETAAIYLQVAEEDDMGLSSPEERQDRLRRATEDVARARARWETDQNGG